MLGQGDPNARGNMSRTTNRSLSRPDRQTNEDVRLPIPAARLVRAFKTFGAESSAVTALRGIDLEFEAGRFTAIMGPSGSGKSTLLHCLAGLDVLDSGQAFIGDTDITRLSDRALTLLRRSELGFVFQAFNLVPSLTVLENITLPLALASREPTSDAIQAVLEMTGLADRVGHLPSELSGGQQQRVAVARALIAKPNIVFADEPTGNLDTHSGTEVLRFLRSAVDTSQQTTVMVTHDPSAAAWADRVVFLVDGQLHQSLDRPTDDSIHTIMKELGR